MRRPAITIECEVTSVLLDACGGSGRPVVGVAAFAAGRRLPDRGRDTRVVAGSKLPESAGERRRWSVAEHLIQVAQQFGAIRVTPDDPSQAAFDHARNRRKSGRLATNAGGS